MRLRFQMRRLVYNIDRVFVFTVHKYNVPDKHAGSISLNSEDFDSDESSQ